MADLDLFETVLRLFVLCFTVAYCAVYTYSVVWTYRDAKARGSWPTFVAILVASVSWPFSLALWLHFRPHRVRTVEEPSAGE